MLAFKGRGSGCAGLRLRVVRWGCGGGGGGVLGFRT